MSEREFTEFLKSDLEALDLRVLQFELRSLLLWALHVRALLPVDGVCRTDTHTIIVSQNRRSDCYVRRCAEGTSGNRTLRCCL